MISRTIARALSKLRTSFASHGHRAQRPGPSIEPLEPRELLAADPQFFDQNDTSWWSYHNLTSSQYSDIFNQRKGDSIPVDFDFTEENGQARIGVVWVKNTANRPWVALRNMSSDTFGQKWNDYKQQGFRLADQESYSLGGTQYYAGIWIKNTENIKWASLRNLTATQFQNAFNTYSADYIPVDMDMYQLNGQTRYSVVFDEDTSNVNWEARADLTSAQFSSLFDSMKGTYRVTDVEAYQKDGQQRYAVVWVKNTNGRGWAERRDLSESQYWNDFNSYVDKGYRLVDYERYRSGNTWRYAAVWRQNGNRPNWSLKSQVDQLATKHLNDFDVPGLSVVIIKNGTTLYRRGFGYQDVNDGELYSSSTINRLASVSKAVAGVLSLDLAEKGLLDLDRKTRSYTGTVDGKSMPSFQSHTLRQLLANRGGVGHYPELGTPSGTFATALAAAAKLWSKPLFGPVGTYHYSTHGYTFLGAAIEGALNKPIKQVVLDYLTNPYHLGSLKPESRSDGNRYRSSLYDSKGNEVSADDLSWKVLGGGLESSAYDLAQFGAKVLNGSILTQSSRNTMWTAPVSDGVKYGLGWSYGTTNGGVKWVAKDGAQLGANTYLLMYPDKGIVVAVVTNMDGNGNNAGTLATNVGKLLLANPSA